MDEKANKQSGLTMNAKDEPASTSGPLSHLYATIDRNVADLRSGEITGHDVRSIAKERRRNEWQAWGPIQGAQRTRGAN